MKKINRKSSLQGAHNGFLKIAAFSFFIHVLIFQLAWGAAQPLTQLSNDGLQQARTVHEAEKTKVGQTYQALVLRKHKLDDRIKALRRENANLERKKSFFNSHKKEIAKNTAEIKNLKRQKAGVEVKIAKARKQMEVERQWLAKITTEEKRRETLAKSAPVQVSKPSDIPVAKDAEELAHVPNFNPMPVKQMAWGGAVLIGLASGYALFRKRFFFKKLPQQVAHSEIESAPEMLEDIAVVSEMPQEESKDINDIMMEDFSVAAGEMQEKLPGVSKKI